MAVQSVRLNDPLQAYIGLSSDPKPIGAEDWALFIEWDTGRRFRQIEGVWQPDSQNPQVTGGAVKVVNGSPAGDLVLGEVANQTTTPTRITPAQVIIGFRAWYWTRGTATGKELRVVFGAADDIDANNKLAAAGSRRLVNLDGSIEVDIDPAENIQRIDFASDAATEAGTKVYYEYLLAP